eukprot:9708602-Heterocapsa_arctica.AAC.1
MSKVRHNKDMLLLACLISMACPNFGSHGLRPLNISRFDHHSRFDPVTSVGTGTRPCGGYGTGDALFNDG